MSRSRQTAAPANLFAYAVIVWIGIIFFSSTSLASEWCERAFAWVSTLLLGRKAMQQPSFSLFHLFADKGLHVTLFLVLAVLLWKTLPIGRFRPFQVLVLGLIIGSCSEFLQRFFPGRDPALRDVIITPGRRRIGGGPERDRFEANVAQDAA